MQEKKPPKLDIGLAAQLWKRPGQATSGWDHGSAQYRDTNDTYWAAAKTTNGASGQWEYAEAFGDVVRNVVDTSWAIADSLGEINSSMKKEYLGALESLGPAILNEVHQGSWINNEVIEDVLYSFVQTAASQMVRASSEVDLKPLTRASDGLAVRAVDDMSASFSKLISYANISASIEDETLKAEFTEKAIGQIAGALDDVSFRPLANAADGFAVRTMEQLTDSLEDMFSLSTIFRNRSRMTRSKKHSRTGCRAR